MSPLLLLLLVLLREKSGRRRRRSGGFCCRCCRCCRCCCCRRLDSFHFHPLLSASDAVFFFISSSSFCFLFSVFSSSLADLRGRRRFVQRPVEARGGVLSLLLSLLLLFPFPPCCVGMPLACFRCRIRLPASEGQELPEGGAAEPEGGRERKREKEKVDRSRLRRRRNRGEIVEQEKPSETTLSTHQRPSMPSGSTARTSPSRHFDGEG